MTAAVSSSMAAAAPAASSRGAKVTSNGVSGTPYQRSRARQVTAAAAAERP